MDKVLISRTFEKEFRRLDAKTRTKVKVALSELGIDPRQPRPNADIKTLADTDPQKYRLRIGDLRIIYTIDIEKVLVIEIFSRGRGYR